MTTFSVIILVGDHTCLFLWSPIIYADKLFLVPFLDKFKNKRSLYMYKMAETMMISKKEYEGMKETIELLQDPEMMKQVLESEKNIKAGKIKKFEY